MQFPKRAYDVGTAAALKLIRHELDVLPIPGFVKGMIPVDKEPAAAAGITKCVLDAVAADPGSAPAQVPQGVPAKPPTA
jgi:hypothetical protein